MSNTPRVFFANAAMAFGARNSPVGAFGLVSKNRETSDGRGDVSDALWDVRDLGREGLKAVGSAASSPIHLTFLIAASVL